MRKLFVAASAVLALGACSSAQIAQTQTEVQQGALVIDTAACDLQTAANATTAVATAAGDTKVASIAQATSVAAGTACMTLAPAAPAASPAPAAAPATS